ncbi:MAG: LptA/OstA family protein [Sedimenticolaceae bacterium]|nr:LptA/OstA family protein [Sedimenticolaceae bacterium]
MSRFTLFLLLLALPLLPVAEEKTAVRVEADNVVHDEATGEVTYSGNVVVTRGEMQLLSDTLVITRDSNTGQGIITATGEPLKFLSNSEGQRVSGDASTATYQVDSRQLELRGSPMHFESVDARGQKLNGSAREARYDMEASFLSMTGSPVRFRQTAAGDEQQPVMGTSSQADYDMNRKLLVLSGDAMVQQDGNTVRNDRIVFNLRDSIITAGARANARERVETLLELE